MSALLPVVGTPSPIFYAVANIVAALAKIVYGDYLAIVANSVDELHKKIPSRAALGNKSVVLLADYPRPDMLELLLGLNAPMAVCVDDFTSVAHYAVAGRGMSSVEAARFGTVGLVNLEPLSASPPATSFFVKDRRIGLAQLVDDLARLYQVGMTGENRKNVLAHLHHAGKGAVSLADFAARTVPVKDDAREVMERRSPLENELIAFLAAQYDEIARGRRLEALEWPVYSLLTPEFPDRLTIGPIDMTGPARCVYFGPYFALSAGLWAADIAIEFGGVYCRDPIMIDVFAGAENVLAAVQGVLPGSGVFGCQIRFEVEDPTEHVQVRTHLLAGQIEGVMRMHSIKLRRLAYLDEPDPDDAEAEPVGEGVG